MSGLKIVLGNKNYSSWSLRGWLPLARAGVEFEEVVIPLDLPETRPRILEHSPSGKVPALIDAGTTVWESLAIAEHVAARFPEAGLWPDDAAARAVARAVSCEMHAGFVPLREHMPMDVRNRYPGQGRTPEVGRDIARVQEIWSECRERYGAGGEFLFGRFTVADAMYAPVVTRFVTYSVDLAPVNEAYRDAVWSLPEMQRWRAAAEEEPWVIDYPVL